MHWGPLDPMHLINLTFCLHNVELDLKKLYYLWHYLSWYFVTVFQYVRVCLPHWNPLNPVIKHLQCYGILTLSFGSSSHTDGTDG